MKSEERFHRSRLSERWCSGSRYARNDVRGVGKKKCRVALFPSTPLRVGEMREWECGSAAEGYGKEGLANGGKSRIG